MASHAVRDLGRTIWNKLLIGQLQKEISLLPLKQQLLLQLLQILMLLLQLLLQLLACWLLPGYRTGTAWLNIRAGGIQAADGEGVGLQRVAAGAGRDEGRFRGGDGTERVALGRHGDRERYLRVARVVGV